MRLVPCLTLVLLTACPSEDPTTKPGRTTPTSSDCHAGPVTVDSMAAVEALRGVTCIEGDLDLSGPDVLDTSPLGDLQRVTGELFVGNTGVKDVSGLARLTRVGALVLSVNPALSDLGDLAGLEAVGTLVVQGHPALTSLDGLQGVPAALEGSLVLDDNPQLTDVAALDHVTSVAGSLELRRGPDLPGAFAAVTSLGGLILERTEQATLSLPQLTEIDGLLDILACASLTEVDLPLLEEVTGDLAVRTSFAMDRIDAPALHTVGGTLQVDGGLFASLGDLGSLTSVGDRLLIRANADLASLSALSALATVGGDVIEIIDNPQLPAATAQGFVDGLSFSGTATVQNNGG